MTEMETKTAEEKEDVWTRIQQGYVVWDSRKTGLVNHTSRLIGIPEMWMVNGRYGMLAYLAYAAFLADREIKVLPPSEKENVATYKAMIWLRRIGVRQRGRAFSIDVRGTVLCEATGSGIQY